MIWTGGAALLAATAVDTVAVIGRQAGFAVHGSIELIQAAVLVAGAIALIVSTLRDSHPRVRILVERIGGLRAASERGGDVLTVVFLAALLAGSAWLAIDLWNSHEVSESAGVPWRWLRLFANLALVAAILVSGRTLFRGRSR
jgi:TRAP-type C4-dicarboxylate transport system permease small subunit